jgi:hypothetical protein
VAGARQDRLAERRAEQDARFAAFRAESASTWQLSGRVHFAGRVRAEDFTPLQREVLDRVAAWGEGVREPQGQRRVHVPLHAHLDSGSGGAAFFYALSGDGRVDLVVFARSTARSGNDYRWSGSNRYVSGPPSLEEVANHPVLTASRALVDQVRAAAGEPVTGRDDTAGSTAGTSTRAPRPTRARRTGLRPPGAPAIWPARPAATATPWTPPAPPPRTRPPASSPPGVRWRSRAPSPSARRGSRCPTTNAAPSRPWWPPRSATRPDPAAGPRATGAPWPSPTARAATRWPRR